MLIEIIRGQHTRHRAEPQPFPRNEREQPLHDAALQVGQMAVHAHRAPKISEPLPRLVWPAVDEPVGQHDGVHGSR